MKQLSTFTVILALTAIFAHHGYAQEAEVVERTVKDIFFAGSTLMLALALGLSFLSVLALAFVLYGFYLVRSSLLVPQAFVDDAVYLLKGGDKSKANTLAQNTDHVASMLLKALLGQSESTYERLVSVAETAAGRGISQVKQRISYLANIGALAPMMGLLGTIIGMIKAFQSVGLSASSNKTIILGEAISEALYTTAWGLMIGILAMGFYYFFKGKLNNVAGDVELAAERMVDAAAQ